MGCGQHRNDSKVLFEHDWHSVAQWRFGAGQRHQLWRERRLEQCVLVSIISADNAATLRACRAMAPAGSRRNAPPRDCVATSDFARAPSTWSWLSLRKRTYSLNFRSRLLWVTSYLLRRAATVWRHSQSRRLSNDASQAPLTSAIGITLRSIEVEARDSLWPFALVDDTRKVAAIEGEADAPSTRHRRRD